MSISAGRRGRAALLLLAGVLSLLLAARPAEPLGIDLEGSPYPFSVSLLPLTVAHNPVCMACMDVGPTGPANGDAVLLLHGRNFPASYWEPVIRPLAGAGFRVIAPDQLGFNKSSKPEMAWSFDDAAANTATSPRDAVMPFDTGHLIHLEATAAFHAAQLRFLNAP